MSTAARARGAAEWWMLAMVVAAAAAGPREASAQWIVGLQGGLPAYTVAGDAPEGAAYTRGIRLMVAGVLGYQFSSSFALRVEPGLIQRGTGVQYEVDGVEEPVDSLTLNLDYVSVPIVAEVFTPGGRGFATLGLDVGFLSSATLATTNGAEEADVKDLLESTDLALLFGVGGLVRRSQPEVALQLRYSQSLGRVFDGTVGGVASSIPQGLRFSGLQLTAGVSWRLGGDR